VGFDILSTITTGLGLQQSNSGNTQFGLQDFYSTATDRGFARDFHFRVTQIGDLTLDNGDLIYIRTSNIPSREIGVDSVNFRGFKYNVPLTASYPGSDNWTVEFLMDKNYGIYDQFENWHRNHFNESTFVGREVPTFSRVIEIMAIDETLSVVKKFRLYGCFPRTLGEIQFNIAGQGAPVTFKMSMAYQYWTSETVGETAASTQGLIGQFVGGLRTLTGILQGGTNIVRSIKSIPGL